MTGHGPRSGSPPLPEALPPSIVPGDLVAGKYRVERVVGEGGMAYVVAATHLQLGERVALKFLKESTMKDPALVARFDHEARASARLKGENVCRVIDVGQLPSGAPYIVMEYLEGQDLEQILGERGRLEVPQAVEYVIQACAGLAEAHARGIVHRDIKPENLFVAHNDGWRVIKILDFGISKAALKGVAEDVNAFSTSSIMGSPCYMPPEQLRSTKDVDHRADIWALGAVLFELVTGLTPYDAHQSLSQLICQVLEQAPRALLEHRPDAPPGLADVVARCLEKDREARFPNAAELAIALLPFAPRRARVAAERAVSAARAAGMAHPGLQLPPSVMPPAGDESGPYAARLSASGSQPIPRFPVTPAPASKDSLVGGASSRSVADLNSRRASPYLVALAGGVAVFGAIGAFAFVKSRSVPPPPAAAAQPGILAAEARIVASVPSPVAADRQGGTVAASPPKTATVHVDTTPAGASVTEGDAELCASTPCDLTFAGAAADAAHRVSLAKAGFLSEVHDLKGGDEPLVVALRAQPVKAAVAPPAAPTKAAANPSPSKPSVPQGFKDIPY